MYFSVCNDQQELKEHLVDELDYKLVPEDIWEYLVKTYGLVNGQEPIARLVSTLSWNKYPN